MPSPRPTGSGALKILLLPQLLEYHIFYLITLPGDPIKPILGFLLGIASICYRPCHLYGFFLLVVVMCLREASFATAGLIPAVLLRTSLGLLRTDHLPVMTTARISSLVMDSYLVALYHMYDT